MSEIDCVNIFNYIEKCRLCFIEFTATLSGIDIDETLAEQIRELTGYVRNILLFLNSFAVFNKFCFTIFSSTNLRNYHRKYACNVKSA